MRDAAIAATGLHTPAESVSNAELVAAFNAFAERFNREHADVIAAGEVAAIAPSSEGFIEKASGIRDGGWDVLGARLKTVFSNNIRNNFGFLNRAHPERERPPHQDDRLFVQQGRKVFKEVGPMVSAMILDHAAELGIDPHGLKRLWLHQSNINMNELIGKRVLGREPTP